MKITESKLRQMIRGVIREFTTTTTGRGAKPKGYQSTGTKAKKSSYDTKKTTATTKGSDYTTKKAAYDTKSAAKTPDQFRYKAKDNPSAPWSYTNDKGVSKKYKTGGTNPDYTSYDTDLKAKETARDTALTQKRSAETARDAAKTDWDSAKEADLRKTKTPKGEKVPSMGGTKFGKGKAAGKGKGKGKKGKKGKDEE